MTISVLLNWPRRHSLLTSFLLLLAVALGYLVYLFQPHGYRNLERLEYLASRCSQSDASLGNAQACFREAGIAVQTEAVGSNEENPIISGRQNIYVHKGDTIVTGTTNSGAHGPIPCGRVDLQIVLVFGSDQRLRDRMVKRVYTCP